MKIIPLLPADTYTVVNKTIITNDDKKNIISLYEPIIGPVAVCLYFTLINDLKLMDFISRDFTHHHLIAGMKSSLETIKQARETLESVGLLKTYFKDGVTNSYVYEIYSPLSPKEFFTSPIFNITLYNNIGKTEYELLKAEYELPKIDLKDYEEVSVALNDTFKSSDTLACFDVKDRNSLNIPLDNVIDFDLLISSFPKGLIKDTSFNKKMRDLIQQLAFIYDLDTLKMKEILKDHINDKGGFDKEEIRKSARNYYQYNNDGRLPTLVYRTQPEYLKSPVGDNSPLAQIIYMFENTSPREFLKIKYKGVNPTNRDLKLIESLIVDLNLQPAVVNVLIDYVLKKNNNKLSQSLVETIAGHWKRCNVETAKEAIELAKKENSKISKKIDNKSSSKKNIVDIKPLWMNEEIVKEEMTEEEIKDFEELLKDFR